MFTYHLTEQIVIGRKSWNIVIDAIREHKFEHIALVYPTHCGFHTIARIRKIKRRLRFLGILYTEYAVNQLTNSIQLAVKTDVILTIGDRTTHDVAKLSNRESLPLYCIETIRGHMSSCGSGVIWQKNKVDFKLLLPNLVFNDCWNIKKWSITDTIYFLHDIPLALDACFNKDNAQNDFLKVSAINGVCTFLKAYAQFKQTKSKRKMRKLFIQMAEADLLMKNAYNNAPLSYESVQIVQSMFHYSQFEIAIAYESLDVFNNHLKRHHEDLSKLFANFGYSLQEIETLFNGFYSDYMNDPLRFESATDILGNKLKEVIKTNQTTRRLM